MLRFPLVNQVRRLTAWRIINRRHAPVEETTTPYNVAFFTKVWRLIPLTSMKHLVPTQEPLVCPAQIWTCACWPRGRLSPILPRARLCATERPVARHSTTLALIVPCSAKLQDTRTHPMLWAALCIHKGKRLQRQLIHLPPALAVLARLSPIALAQHITSSATRSMLAATSQLLHSLLITSPIAYPLVVGIFNVLVWSMTRVPGFVLFSLLSMGLRLATPTLSPRSGSAGLQPTQITARCHRPRLPLLCFRLRLFVSSRKSKMLNRIAD